MWELVQGILSITVLGAENLLPIDFQGKSDPYVVLYMMKQKRLRKKTTVRYLSQILTDLIETWYVNPLRTISPRGASCFVQQL